MVKFKLSSTLNKFFIYFLAFIIFCSLFNYFYFTYYCQTHILGRTEFGKFPVIDPTHVDKSYTLISPFIAKQNFTEPGKVYLLNLVGKPVHVWNTRYQTLYARLKPNGNVVVSMIYPTDIFNYPGGKTGLIQELDWDGNILWEYYNNYIHHDFEIMSNGNIALLVTEKIPHEIAKNIQGGLKDRNDPEVVSDGIIEINREGKVVWSWHSYEHLSAQENSIDYLTPKSEWTHANSIRFFSDYKSKSGFLISLRHLNKVIMIEKSTGDVFWESPKGMLSYQHDATLLDNGNILVFDNGLFRKQKKPLLSSRVLEINPDSKKVVWEFNGGETGPEKARFAASIMSGTQRLKNGNTLVINAIRGHLFEISKDGKLVWDFINPFLSKNTGSFDNNIIFKAQRYYSEDIPILKKLSPPLPFFSSMCRFRSW